MQPARDPTAASYSRCLGPGRCRSMAARRAARPTGHSDPAGCGERQPGTPSSSGDRHAYCRDRQTAAPPRHRPARRPTRLRAWKATIDRSGEGVRIAQHFQPDPVEDPVSPVPVAERDHGFRAGEPPVVRSGISSTGRPSSDGGSPGCNALDPEVVARAGRLAASWHCPCRLAPHQPGAVGGVDGSGSRSTDRSGRRHPERRRRSTSRSRRGRTALRPARSCRCRGRRPAPSSRANSSAKSRRQLGGQVEGAVLQQLVGDLGGDPRLEDRDPLLGVGRLAHRMLDRLGNPCSGQVGGPLRQQHRRRR